MNCDLVQGCANCPFRCDRPIQHGWLGQARAQDIIDTLFERDQTFACHKTAGDRDEYHCAGAMILLEKQGRANQHMRIMERVGFYDRNKLKMDGPIFDTPEQFVAWHNGEEVETEYHRRIAKEKRLLAQDENKENTAEWMEQKNKQLSNLLNNLENQGVKRESFDLSPSPFLLDEFLPDGQRA